MTPSTGSLLAAGVNSPGAAEGAPLWAQADGIVMKNAGAVPGVWGRPLFYRADTLSNVFVSEAFNQYDYVALGTSLR